jgi:hypothetical protein
VKGAASRARDPADCARLREFAEQIVTGPIQKFTHVAKSAELEVLMATYPDRADATQYEPVPRVVVDRPVALFGAWYEFFHARQRVTGIADRPFRIACRAWTTQKRWGSTFFIFRRSIQSAKRAERVGITRSPAKQTIRECRGRSVATLADTKRWSRR